MNAKGWCEHDVKNKVKAGWLKWKEIAGVLCDAKMPKYLKGKVYKTMIRPVQRPGHRQGERKDYWRERK